MLAALVLLLGLALLIGWEILCLGQVVLAERVDQRAGRFSRVSPQPRRWPPHAARAGSA